MNGSDLKSALERFDAIREEVARLSELEHDAVRAQLLATGHDPAVYSLRDLAQHIVAHREQVALSNAEAAAYDPIGAVT